MTVLGGTAMAWPAVSSQISGSSQMAMMSVPSAFCSFSVLAPGGRPVMVAEKGSAMLLEDQLR